MSRVAIASISDLAAQAGAEAADAGGNAVDAAVAAALTSAVTAPGMCSLGGGGYATVWPTAGVPETIDGGHEMPGRGLASDEFGGGRIDVHLEYGGGVNLTVGPGSVATPGALAACASASQRHGKLAWREVVEPARRHAASGFPMPRAAYDYLRYAHEVVYGWNPDSYAALHDERGQLVEPDTLIHVPHLADTLQSIADEGPDALYRGELGRLASEYVRDGGGILTREDLAAYRPVTRNALQFELDAWKVATNPPPAVGGAALAGMTLLMRGWPRDGWTPEALQRLIDAQRAVLDFRKARLEGSDQLPKEVDRLLAAAGQGDMRLLSAPSTVHTSAVDSEGLACAITLSDGYGSGVMPPGTGLWMNNALGEKELNPRGFHGWPPGRRIPSNMAPTVARGARSGVLAIGSPGADRITTAILQTMIHFMHMGMSLADAVARPRLHVERLHGVWQVAYEAGLAVEELDVVSRRFDAHSMFFGGVAAAFWSPEAGFQVAADDRRAGGTAVAGSPGPA
jgi:gamma-glutamyltranspeptidase/glutathione hydrolase